jgi:hypothetical protein
VLRRRKYPLTGPGTARSPESHRVTARGVTSINRAKSKLLPEFKSRQNKTFCRCPGKLSADIKDSPSKLSERQSGWVSFSAAGQVKNDLHEQGFEPGVHEKLTALLQVQRRPRQVPPFVPVPLILNRWQAIDRSGAAECREQGHVLVRSAELVKSPECVVPTLVRLHAEDLILRFLPHALHFAIEVLPFAVVTNRALKNRKLVLIGRGAAVRKDKRVHEVVEGGSKILYAIARYGAQVFRDRFSTDDHDKVASRVGIRVHKDFEGFSGPESP